MVSNVILTLVGSPSLGQGGPPRAILAMLKSTDKENLVRCKFTAVFTDEILQSSGDMILIKGTQVKKGPLRVITSNEAIRRLIKRLVPKPLYIAFISSSILFILNLRKGLKESLEGGYSIIHAHDFHSAYLVCLLQRYHLFPHYPVILTLHGKGSSATESVLQSWPEYKSTLLEKWLRRVERGAVASSSVITFPSRGAVQLLERDYPGILKGKEAKIVYNGIDVPGITILKDDSSLYAKYAIPKKRLLLCVANFVREKGVQYLIAAVNVLPQSFREDIVVVIIGRGPLKADLSSLIMEHNLEEVIRLLDPVPNKEIIQLMKMADVFVLPSLVSVFDLVLLEAMAAGTPIITTRVGGNLEMLDDSSALLVEPENAAALAQAIEQLLDDPDLRNRLSKNAYVRAASNFSLDNMVNGYLCIYKELFSRTSSVNLASSR